MLSVLAEGAAAVAPATVSASAISFLLSLPWLPFLSKLMYLALRFDARSIPSCGSSTNMSCFVIDAQKVGHKAAVRYDGR